MHMINLIPTFLSEYRNASRGLPEGIDTKLNIPTLVKAGKKITVRYEDKSFFKNSAFPAELYEYRRGKNMKLSIDGKYHHCLQRETLREIFAMKTKVSNLIDLCRQYMKNGLEWQIGDEVKNFESTQEADDEKSLEYHYDLRETIRHLMITCIVFLNLASILIYPNETFYMKYVNNKFRIEANEALQMTNKICKRMQDEFIDIIYENFPIRETVARISRAEKETDDVFDTKEVISKES